MVKLTKIYTRGGDSGETSLGDGARVPKDDIRVAAYGAVDEANAAIGLARSALGADLADLNEKSKLADAILERVLNDMFDLGADLCTPEDGKRANGALRVTPDQPVRLEQEIDAVNDALDPLESFVLPGGSAAAAHMHLARTITRRAERLVVTLARTSAVNPAVVTYLNRLSDLLFVLARHCNDGGKGDVLWKPGANR
ncbi:MAG: cob(I)yrinic acid a,c-diamide adenosyltransferase [Rhodospirillaceae bacterium]|jgi:cob(I)alamin adenosyltransferase|nr:cob(I)yrinic acid a,c-diamide adenosyltransferase [Rhodospirillaceae bacterium]MBT5666734.1 cob(I)yrinic acid a,c-diamide adenosyltransferase [Rhodospirillaceae bacterium]MBT5811204.1 cob(I)yrinic acid a,c-diamide adenosyltransferase [Rhodospirillaceae bacterium]